MKKTILMLSTLTLYALSQAVSADTVEKQMPQGQLSVHTEQVYSSWKSEAGAKGYQLATPFSLTYQNKNFDAGIRRAFIISSNKTPDREGKVSHWSDTSLSLGYSAFSQSNFPVRFNLSANLPNGKATLSGKEKNAVMDGNLVWQTRFGEGFNITPGISIAHSFTGKDTVGFGMSYGWRGKFDPNSDVENDEINPGNETVATLNYQRNSQRYSIDTGITYRHAGVTKRDGKDYYRKGVLWSFETNAAAALTEKHQVYGGLYFARRKRDHYINNATGNLEIEQFNSNGNTLSANIGYSYRLKPNANIGLTADYLKVGSNSYDQINALFVPKRKKWSVGANYRHQWSNKLTASISAKRFKMHDDESPYISEQDFKGWNVSASLKYMY